MEKLRLALQGRQAKWEFSDGCYLSAHVDPSNVFAGAWLVVSCDVTKYAQVKTWEYPVLLNFQLRILHIYCSDWFTQLRLLAHIPSLGCWMRDLLWPTRRYLTRGLFIISCPAFARQNNCLTFPYFQIYLSCLESLRFKLNLWWEGSLLLLHKKRCLWREAVRENFVLRTTKRFQRIKKEQSPLFGVVFVCVFRQTSKFMVLVFLEARGKPFSSRKLLVKF